MLYLIMMSMHDEALSVVTGVFEPFSNYLGLDLFSWSDAQRDLCVLTFRQKNGAFPPPQQVNEA